MTKEELLKQCRYYKGVDEYPWGETEREVDPKTGKRYQNMRMFWWIERNWVQGEGEISDGAKYYLFLTKKEGHKPIEGIPLDLLCVIHSIWGKNGGEDDLDMF